MAREQRPAPAREVDTAGPLLELADHAIAECLDETETIAASTDERLLSRLPGLREHLHRAQHLLAQAPADAISGQAAR